MNKSITINNLNSVIIPFVIAAVLVILIAGALIYKHNSEYVYSNDTKRINVKNATLKSIIYNVIYSVVIVLVLAIAVGYKPYIVLSGSMRPSIQPGDVVIDYALNSINDYNVGDVITFTHASDVATTHQIVAIKKDGTKFMVGDVINFVSNGVEYTQTLTSSNVSTSGNSIITCGTANTGTIDSAIEFANIQGKVFFTIPALGLGVQMVKSVFPATFMLSADSQADLLPARLDFIGFIISIIIIFKAKKSLVYIPEYNAE